MVKSLKIKIGDWKADLTFQRGKGVGILRYLEIAATIVLAAAGAVKAMSLLGWV